MSDQRLNEHLDRGEIRHIIELYCRCVDRRDYSLISEIFWPDAIIDSGAFIGSPREFVESRSSEASPSRFSQHHITTHICELDGESAKSETYWVFHSKNETGPVTVASGRYLDRHERRSGRWRIAFRYNLVEIFRSADALEDPFAAIDNVYANGVSSRDRNDPSFRRPFVNLRIRR